MGVDHIGGDAGLRQENRKLRRELSRVAKATLQNASIGRAGIRVYDGGSITFEGGGGIVIRDSGYITIDGDLTGAGDFDWTGPWDFSGPGVVTGDVAWSGDLNLTGDIKVLSGGKIQVGSGASAIIIDGAAGTITVPGSHPIKLNQFGSLATLSLGTTGRIWSGGDGVSIAHVGGGGGAGSMNIYSDGIDLLGDVHVSALDPLPEGVTAQYVLRGSDGQLYAGSPGGGGGGGNPPMGNPDGYIWPSDPAVFGISDDFADHVARGSAEPGVDVRTPVGTPIWAPADGTIVAVSNTTSGATGRYITLVTDDGDWFRFLHASAVAVSVNQTVSQTDLLGYTGGSGFGSEAYYGPHLHLSFAIGYTGLFPGASAMDDFEAYMASV